MYTYTHAAHWKMLFVTLTWVSSCSSLTDMTYATALLMSTCKTWNKMHHQALNTYLHVTTILLFCSLKTPTKVNTGIKNWFHWEYTTTWAVFLNFLQKYVLIIPLHCLLFADLLKWFFFKCILPLIQKLPLEIIFHKNTHCLTLEKTEEKTKHYFESYKPNYYSKQFCKLNNWVTCLIFIFSEPCCWPWPAYTEIVRKELWPY